MFRSTTIFVLLLAVTLAGLAHAADNQGFIYGTVTLREGTQHTGFLRWDGEEAFWDDLFHSRQQDIPWVDHVDMNELNKEKKRQYYKTHGLIDRIAYSLEHDDDDINLSRLFIVRYGDIQLITIDDDENITITMNDGATQPVRGYSNDVSSDILVFTGAEEPVTLEWDDLAEIRFAATPPEATPYATRLYGRVKSSRGDFEGFIQWDNSECTSIDVMDSRQEDVLMGDIRSVEQDPGEGSIVTMKDGRILNLSGSNDVGRGHRGVFVETADQGRVTIPWSRFEQVDFVDGMGSGNGRETFSGNTALNGTVTDTDGAVFEGRFVFDMDEARMHDIFNGSAKDVKYNIRFSLIASISPEGPESSLVVLRSGQTLKLDDDQDTGKSNGGILLFETGAEQARYLPWSRLRKIQMAP